MSTKTTKSPKTTTRPTLAGAEQQDHQAMQRRLRQFRARYQPYVATIIAAGLFGSDEAWTGVLARLAEDDAAVTTKALVGLFHRLEQASPDSTRIPDGPHHEELAEDVLTTHVVSWSDTGFLLGLAVGMQLGPHAFDGGVK